MEKTLDQGRVYRFKVQPQKKERTTNWLAFLNPKGTNGCLIRGYCQKTPSGQIAPRLGQELNYLLGQEVI